MSDDSDSEIQLDARLAALATPTRAKLNRRKSVGATLRRSNKKDLLRRKSIANLNLKRIDSPQVAKKIVKKPPLPSISGLVAKSTKRVATPQSSNRNKRSSISKPSIVRRKSPRTSTIKSISTTTPKKTAAANQSQAPSFARSTQSSSSKQIIQPKNTTNNNNNNNNTKTTTTATTTTTTTMKRTLRRQPAKRISARKKIDSPIKKTPPKTTSTTTTNRTKRKRLTIDWDKVRLFLDDKEFLNFLKTLSGSC
jgi:hypothetical protein